ncbi:MAG: DUF4864 domain-containing protein [Burkholderiales bacterium]|nr:DUF4864 domain-containing protein [Burkholderiales bacterium]
MQRRAFAALSLMMIAARAHAVAGVTAAESRAVEAVVRGQLDAFSRDDAEAAFAFAAAGIRARFGTAARFMEMVRAGYAVVIRPRTTVFLKPTREERAILQAVQFVDAQGETWLATYALIREANAGWRIAGVHLMPGSQRVT